MPFKHCINRYKTYEMFIYASFSVHGVFICRSLKPTYIQTFGIEIKKVRH